MKAPGERNGITVKPTDEETEMKRDTHQQPHDFNAGSLSLPEDLPEITARSTHCALQRENSWYMGGSDVSFGAGTSALANAVDGRDLRAA